MELVREMAEEHTAQQKRSQAFVREGRRIAYVILACVVLLTIISVFIISVFQATWGLSVWGNPRRLVILGRAVLGCNS